MSVEALSTGRQADEPIAGPSNRSFGLTVGGILLALAALKILISSGVSPFAAAMLVAGAVLASLALVWPGSLTRANRAWMRLGVLMAQVMNPVILFLIYAVAFVPIGLAMRLAGHDPLARRRRPAGASYWQDRTEGPARQRSMTDQF